MVTTAEPKVKDVQRSMDALFQAVEAFRTFDPEMQAQVMGTFLLVAKRPGISIGGIAQALGMSLPAISRAVATMSRVRSPGQSGYDLIETEQNPDNRRERLCTLTPKGERFASTLASLL